MNLFFSVLAQQLQEYKTDQNIYTINMMLNPIWFRHELANSTLIKKFSWIEKLIRLLLIVKCDQRFYDELMLSFASYLSDETSDQSNILVFFELKT